MLQARDYTYVTRCVHLRPTIHWLFRNSCKRCSYLFLPARLTNMLHFAEVNLFEGDVIFETSLVSTRRLRTGTKNI